MSFDTGGSEPRYRFQNFLAVLAIAALFDAFHLGGWSLGESEAYSALAASRQSLSAVVAQALHFDPGKPPLYHILLHWFIGLAGLSEAGLRAFSVIFALAALILLYSLALKMFGPETALATVMLWAFNPLALILGQWARMYSMFICSVIASLLAFWCVRERADLSRLAVFAVCGTLMLYTHLCGLLFAGVEIAILLRDVRQGRRAAAPWVGLVIAFVLFGPFLPTEIAQGRGMLFTHWLDWIGTAQAAPSWYKAVTLGIGALVTFGLVFGPQFETDDREPVRFCAIWLLIPIMAFGAVSITVRPVFSPRYVAPAIPALAALAARSLRQFSAPIRNLSAAGIATAFAVLFLFYRAGRYEPWRDIAQQVRAAGAVQPVFFESGLVVSNPGRREEAIGGFLSGFPDGYFRVPFDYYFKGPNPRRTIDPSNPARAREAIAEAAAGAGGAWLISGKSGAAARLEMPNLGQFRIERVLHHDYATLYHIVPLAQGQNKAPVRRVQGKRDCSTEPLNWGEESSPLLKIARPNTAA